MKFYTEEGNWDLVGNNLKIFFIRDAIKFPDFIHSFKPDPITNIQDPQRQFDFVSEYPETLHMITFVFSPWGIPADYRHMQGSGVNTYKWVNADGEAVLIKYHWEPKEGIKNLTTEEANDIQGKSFNHATQDLYEAIENGDYPEWELFVQILSDDDHPELDFDPLDDTKIWPKDQVPWYPVGRMVLNKNPDNYFAEVEQSAFGTGVLVDGLDFSDDKMLQGRTFSYSDTQRYRVGTNYLQLPVNAAKKHVATNQRDGQMAYYVDEADGQNPHVNYEPSGLDGLHETDNKQKEYTPHVEGNLVYESIERTNNFKQAGDTYRAFDDTERDDLINNLVSKLGMCEQKTQQKMIDMCTKADEDYGRRLAEGLRQHAGNDDENDGMRETQQKGHRSDSY